MEIKMKLNDVLGISRILKFMIDGSGEKTDLLLKFKMLGIIKALEPFVENFEAVRDEKIMELGKQTESGSFEISPDDKDVVKEFNNAMAVLTHSDVTVYTETLAPEDVFDKGLAADDLIRLYPVIRVQNKEGL